MSATHSTQKHLLFTENNLLRHNISSILLTLLSISFPTNYFVEIMIYNRKFKRSHNAEKFSMVQNMFFVSDSFVCTRKVEIKTINDFLYSYIL